MCPGGPAALRRLWRIERSRCDDSGESAVRIEPRRSCSAWHGSRLGGRIDDISSSVNTATRCRASHAVLALGEEPAGGCEMADDCTHGACGSRGGARIVCPRSKV